MRNFTRRDLLAHGAAASATLLLPSRLSAQPSKPARQLTVACIGAGSQGLRVLLDLLRIPEVQVVAVCDVNRQTSDYLDWGPNELRNKVRLMLQDPAWGAELAGPTAGRDVGQSIVNVFYARNPSAPAHGTCNAYEDFRDLLAHEKNLDAVVVSTPDHWHAVIANVAIRTQELLEWDPSGFRLTRGSDRAAALLMPQYRPPWSAT
jgi:hypothetical protein